MTPNPSLTRRRFTQETISVALASPLILPSLLRAQSTDAGPGRAAAPHGLPDEELRRHPVFRPSRNWAEYAPRSGTWGCCRDAHVIAHPDYGHIQYYVTWIKGTAGRRVALGAAVSDNLVAWQDAGPVMIRDRADGFSTTSMESPCVVAKDGRYYMFYKHRNETRLVVSDDPLQFTDKEDVCFSIAHAAEVFEAGGRWHISSCSRDLLDLKHEKTDRTQGLFLANIEWAATGPAVTPFRVG
jgi:hypothetical protein